MSIKTSLHQLIFKNKEKPAFNFRQRFKALKNLPAFFRLVWKASPWMTVGNIVLRLLRAFQPLAVLMVAKLIMDEVVTMVSHKEVGDMHYLLKLIAIEFALAVLNDLLGRGIALLDGLIGDLFANETSVKLMEHAAYLDLYYFEDSVFYDKLERARRQTLNRSLLMAQILGQAQETITLVSLAAGIAAFNPWLILLLVIAVIPAFLGESHFNERSYSLIHGWTAERRELDYLRLIGTGDETAKEVKIFGLSDFLIGKYRELSQRFYIANRKLSLRRALWGSSLTALGTLAHYGTYVYIIFKTVTGTLSIGQLTFFMGSFARMRGLLDNLFARFSGIVEGGLYLDDLFGFFLLKPTIHSPEKPARFPSPIKHGFTFENVGYRYPNSDQWAVRQLSFTLKAGEKLALVGENGAGKTTIVKLLTRLYDPTEGRILVDGTDIREFDIAELRKEIGVIFQDFVRYQMTAYTNVAVGRSDEMTHKEKVVRASEMSLADTVINKLPEGYDQMIGKRFANGVDLSGGEWQKIALARSYMRNAQVIVLDEPTAALDARAEHEVFQRFSSLTQNKSALLISHRFSTVRMADRILVLENGRMAEIGTHEELMEKKGNYAALFDLQAKGYR